MLKGKLMQIFLPYILTFSFTYVRSNFVTPFSHSASDSNSLSAQLSLEFWSHCLVNTLNHLEHLFSISFMNHYSHFHEEELIGTSQVIEAGHHQKSDFFLYQSFLLRTNAFLNLRTFITSSKSWLPLQCNFTDIILITSYKSCANQKMMSNARIWWQSWNWNPDSPSVTVLSLCYAAFMSYSQGTKPAAHQEDICLP